MCSNWSRPKCAFVPVRQRETVFNYSHTHPTMCACVCMSWSVCVSSRPLKYSTDSNQIPVDVSSQQTDQWRLPVRSSDPGLLGSLAVHPPWRSEVSGRGGGLEAAGNGWGGTTSKDETMCCQLGNNAHWYGPLEITLQIQALILRINTKTSNYKASPKQ